MQVYKSEDKSGKSCMSSAVWYDDDTIIVGSNDGQMQVFDLRSGKVAQVLSDGSGSSESGSGAAVYSMSHSQDLLHPHKFYAGYADCRIRTFDMKMAACSHNVQVHTDAVTATSLNVDSNVLISASHDSRVRVWDLDGFTCVQDIEPQYTHHSKFDEV